MPNQAARIHGSGCLLMGLWLNDYGFQEEKASELIYSQYIRVPKGLSKGPAEGR